MPEDKFADIDIPVGTDQCSGKSDLGLDKYCKAVHKL
jgi:hypothetical protein